MGKKKISRLLKITLICVACLVALYIIGGFVSVHLVLKNAFARVEEGKYWSRYTTYEDFKTTLPREKLTFMSGENELVGYVYGDKASSAGVVIFVHGFGGSQDAYLSQIEFLVNRDWCVFAFDGTGVKASGGTSRVSLYQAVYDLEAAIVCVKGIDVLADKPLALMGHSQGGLAVCAVLNYEAGAAVDAVVSIAGMNTARSMVEASAKEAPPLLFYLMKPFLVMLDRDDFGGESYTAVEGINKANIPVMLIQGTKDVMVTPDEYATTHFTNLITNPNVVTVFCSDEWNSGHENIVSSESAFDYLKAANEALSSYINSLGRPAANDDLRNWATEYGFDKLKANETNGVLFGTINDFLHIFCT
ncbi:MAG: alpha/beta hydrolase [Tannerella sp.]|jgi:pimeloyl-ACP methyl ester carboxylesterase|nr:alpha/beta hydrolase [Tannerella sp.]